MDPNNNNSKKIRVVMFPWLAYGHITPYLELAKKLTNTNLFIAYICSTSATLSCIEKKITPNLSNSIKLVPFNLPNSMGLPPELHTTNGLPLRLNETLIQAFRTSINIFPNILADLKPDLLIYDTFQPWAASLAREQHNIPAVMFMTSGAASVSFFYHMLLYPDVEFPFPKIYFREYENGMRKHVLEKIASNSESKKKHLEGSLVSHKIVLIKGFTEIDGKYMDYLTSLVGNRHVAVGALVQEPSHNEKDDEILSWLAKKQKRSTVLVSFGSEYFPTKEDIQELAQGLELISSKMMINFIWVLRFDKLGEGSVRSRRSLLEKTLPLGFLDSVGDKGMILEWAPQTKILRHPSVGGFTSHCGWSSVTESMYFGVPIIAMPIQVDQPANARLVEEVGVGVEVLKDKKGKFRGETIAGVISYVVLEDGGEVVRKRAAEIGKKLRNNEGEHIDEVVKELVSLCNMTK